MLSQFQFCLTIMFSRSPGSKQGPPQTPKRTTHNASPTHSTPPSQSHAGALAKLTLSSGAKATSLVTSLNYPHTQNYPFGLSALCLPPLLSSLLLRQHHNTDLRERLSYRTLLRVFHTLSSRLQNSIASKRYVLPSQRLRAGGSAVAASPATSYPRTTTTTFPARSYCIKSSRVDRHLLR